MLHYIAQTLVNRYETELEDESLSAEEKNKLLHKLQNAQMLTKDSEDDMNEDSPWNPDSEKELDVVDLINNY